MSFGKLLGVDWRLYFPTPFVPGKYMRAAATATRGFCIYLHTHSQGAIPLERDAKGAVVVYETELEAQRVIAEDAIERLRQFLRGERGFDDAMTVEEYVVAVNVMPDGSISDGEGRCFTRIQN
jgi:hypothetical protein